MSSQSPLSSAPIVAFVGPFGAGKTEIAISYSLAAQRAGSKTILADLDIVTPYFRVGDCRQQLEDMGVSVIAPPGALASFENPAISPAIGGALHHPDAQVVLDVGGDPEGARLLGVYAPQIARRHYELWLVMNPYRPGSALESVVIMRQTIEGGTGLRVSALVANPHLGPLTEPAHIERGLGIVEQASALTGLPIAFLAVAERLLPDLPPLALPLLPLRLMLRLPWQSA